MRVSIIIPVIREEKFKRCYDAIKQNAGIPEEDYEIIFSRDTERIGVAKMVKQLVARSQAELVCFLGDDTIPQRDFLNNALRAMSHLPEGWGMVSFNDNPTTSRSAAHWVCSKRLLPLLDGEFFHTGYKHCYCDDELMIRCQQLNRYIYAYDAILIHDHFIFKENPEPDDEDLKRVYSPEVKDADHRLFISRLNNKWQTPPTEDGVQKVKDLRENKTRPPTVLIAIPANDDVKTEFCMNLVNLCLYTISQGIYVSLMTQQSSLIEAARNIIVQTALQKHTIYDYVLMLDSDMTFPPDLITRLVAHKKEVVCCNAVTRRKPVRSVIKGLDGQPVAPYIGLTEIAKGTSAVMLVKTSALGKMRPPHYAVEWDQATGLSFVGEDYYFTAKLRRCGFKVYCDTDIRIGHIGSKTYFVDEELGYKNSNLRKRPELVKASKGQKPEPVRQGDPVEPVDAD